MKPSIMALVLTQILLTVGAQVLWKTGLDRAGGFLMPGQSAFGSTLELARSGRIWVGLMLYLGATVLWFFLLARHELSLIYPFLSLTFVASLLAAALFLGEPVGSGRWLGVGLITVGVALLSRTGG